jgi:asparagine synthase (glutamine-hydrolysing)
MCGIVGIIKKSMLVSQEELISMNNSQIHRGPDGEGYYINKNLGIAHRRLSIIDVENGYQPMFSDDKQIVITYNGELYNFKEIKNTLINLNYTFKTESDTEVIIYAYKEWGSDCVNKFRGMFAFCIIDHSKQELFLARDHFGIKPLNYRISKNFFAFASEIHTLEKIDNESLTGSLNALNLFLKYNYIPNPYTIYNEIFKLEPGHFLKINFNGEIVEHIKYYDIDFQVKKQSTQETSNTDFDEIFKDSVSAHLVSDVDFGSFLSGGIDSTLTTLEMSKILKDKVKSYSIGFEEEEFNELEFATFAAKTINTNLEFEKIEKNSLLYLPDLINKHFGEPFGDNSILPTYHVSRLASKKVKMVLTGDGGDEFFAGYSRYQTWLRNSLTKVISEKLKKKSYLEVPRYLIGTIKLYLKNHFSFNFNKEWDNLVSNSDIIISNLLNKNLRGQLRNPMHNHHKTALHFNRLSYAQYMDIKTYLCDDILFKVDICSMANSLETRTPFIDVKVAEYATRLPKKSLCNLEEKSGKLILKQLLSKTFPKSFIYREKKGFAIPSNSWLMSDSGAQMLNDYLFGEKSDLENFFNLQELSKLFANYQNKGGQYIYFQPLWNVFIFSIWRERHKKITFT